MKVGRSGGIAVYGYRDELGNNDETTAPMNGITMKDMAAADFLNIPDVNIIVTGY